MKPTQQLFKEARELWSKVFGSHQDLSCLLWLFKMAHHLSGLRGLTRIDLSSCQLCPEVASENPLLPGPCLKGCVPPLSAESTLGSLVSPPSSLEAHPCHAHLIHVPLPLTSLGGLWSSDRNSYLIPFLHLGSVPSLLWRPRAG